MVKYQTLPHRKQTQDTQNPKFYIYYGFDDYRYDVEFLDSFESIKVILLKFDSFPPPPPIALSVVSKDVFAPHKMAEISPGHSNEEVPDPRMPQCPPPPHTHTNLFSSLNGLVG